MPGRGVGMGARSIEEAGFRTGFAFGSSVSAVRLAMPDYAGLERIGIKIAIYPREILAASVHAVRAVLAGMKGGAKPALAGPSDLAIAIRSAHYPAQDVRWPDPR